MREPKFGPHFPMEEFEDRRGRIRKAMASEGLDALILARQENLEYASGFTHDSWLAGFRDFTQQVVIFADPAIEPALVAPCDLQGCFATSAISDIRPVRDLTPAGNMKVLMDVLSPLGAHPKIGIERPADGRPSLPQIFIEELENGLKAALSDCTELMDRVRMIKSPREIAFVREACRITSEAVEAGVRAVRLGASEAEIANVIALEMVRLSGGGYASSPWFIYVYADGKSPVAWDGVASDYRFREGDCVYIDAGYRKYGYYADMIRIVSLGEPLPDKKKIFEVSREVNHELIRFMKPGLRSSEVYRRLYETYEKLGYKKEIDAALEGGFVCEGHGIGLSVHEPPYIVPDCDIILEPGMTMSLEPNLFLGFPFENTRVALKPENNILITENGCELLSTTPDDMRVAAI
ncbi:MAG: aminopeptidase P family protein [Clostridia bacterium]|nr:aminopeptidase P family protein [Clostridia bacterium]